MESLEELVALNRSFKSRRRQSFFTTHDHENNELESRCHGRSFNLTITALYNTGTANLSYRRQYSP